ncbi:MAG: V-type ATPase subunit [Clostridia bacterium]|nr:V-type ATPase subunit [Clostridia bacterium]
MKDIDYATAVARVRVNENSLLNSSDIDRLVAAKSEDEAIAVLQEKGFLSAGENIENALSSVVLKSFSLIKEIAPDKSEFDFLLIKNDFHNLKTVLKGVITDTDYKDYLISPSVIDIGTIETAVNEQKFSILPKYMSDVALNAYNYFVTTSDGQLSDICIDKGSLEAVLTLSQDNKNGFIRDLGELIVASIDMRIAVRAAKIKQSDNILKQALCDLKSLSAEKLIFAAGEGVEAVADYIANTKYSAAALELSKSVGDFEKWCDNALVDFVSSSRYSSFGPGPLAAYIVRTEALQKTVRIIISGKRTGLAENEIKQRIRAVY